MSKQRLTWLLEQHLADSITAQEQLELSELVKADGNEELIKQVLSELLQTATPGMPVHAAPWQKMIREIVSLDKAPATPAKRPARVFTIYRWAAAAAVLLLIGAGVYLLTTRSPKPTGTASQSTLPALPVTPVNKNSLQLADGSRIWLDEVNNGKIATLEGTTITKKDSQIIYTTTSNSNEIYYNVVSTARSRQYEVILPDGSHVWLNAASAIRFPASFTGKERSVELLGEAWFDVQHADKIPFVDSIWDVIHTFIRVPAGFIVAYAATNHLDPSITIPATLVGGGLALSSHGTKAAVRLGANLSPEPVSNWVLSFIEDIIAFIGTLLAVFAPVVIAIVLGVFVILFLWFLPKVARALRKLFSAIAALFRGEGLQAAARKAS